MQADLGQMRAADLTDNRQPQSGTGHLLIASVKALEYPIPLFKWYAGAIIFDFQYGGRRDPQNHVATRRRVSQCVIHQIAQQFVQ
ncbi:hypothetical protein D3C85_1078670 [compost metagenome]